MRNVFDYLSRAADAHGDRCAVEHDTARISYAELAERARRLAAGLRMCQIPRGAAIGIALNEPLTVCEALFGVWYAGCIAVPLSGGQSGVAIYCAQNNVAAVLASEDTVGDFDTAFGGMTTAPRLFVQSPHADAASTRSAAREMDTISAPALSLLVPHPTGLRAAKFTHSHLVGQQQVFLEALPDDSGASSQLICIEPRLTPVSIFALLASVRAGSTLRMEPRLDRRPLHSLLTCEVASVWGSPASYARLPPPFAASGRLSTRITHVVAIGSTKLEDPERVERAFGAPVHAAYGPIEGLCTVCWSARGSRKPGSFGRVHSGYDHCLGRHVNDVEILHEQVGRHLFRGPTFCDTYTTSKGEERVRDAGGWFTTPHTGYVDEDGDLFHFDPESPFMQRNAERFSLQEVEHAITALGADHCFALRQFDPRDQERLIACVSFRPGTQLTATQLHDHLSRSLAPHKLPDAYAILNPPPITPNGLLDRRALRRRGMIELAPPNIPRDTRTLDPWLRACGLHASVARAYSEPLEQGLLRGDSAEYWQSKILSAVMTISSLEQTWIDEFGFADELERLGYMSSEARADLLELQMERRGATRRGYRPPLEA